MRKKNASWFYQSWIGCHAMCPLDQTEVTWVIVFGLKMWPFDTKALLHCSLQPLLFRTPAFAIEVYKSALFYCTYKLSAIS